MLKNFNKDRCYIIAEIGGNFTTFDEAKILVDLANNSGVDAVKLQTYKADTIVTKTAKFDLDNVGDMVQHQLFQKYQIDFDLHKKVFDYIESKGLDWFSTPSHKTDVDMLEELGVKVHKIGADDATNLPLIKYTAVYFIRGKFVASSAPILCTFTPNSSSISTSVLCEGVENQSSPFDSI